MGTERAAEYKNKTNLHGHHPRPRPALLTAEMEESTHAFVMLDATCVPGGDSSS